MAVHQRNIDMMSLRNRSTGRGGQQAHCCHYNTQEDQGSTQAKEATEFHGHDATRNSQE
jgi:hypothetical protein